MKLFAAFLIFLVVLSYVNNLKTNRKRKFSRQDLKQDFALSSFTLEEGEEIDSQYTPDGKDINPNIYGTLVLFLKTPEVLLFQLRTQMPPEVYFITG
jgi:hypothetical protein